MASFKFRYQKILDIRVQEEDDKKQILATKIADIERIKLKLAEIKKDRLAFEDKILKEMQAGVSARRIAGYNRSKKWYRDEIREYETRLVMAQKSLDKARDDLIKATQEVKKMEKLKEKALDAYRAQEEKAMQEMIEEAISFQLAKQMEN